MCVFHWHAWPHWYTAAQNVCINAWTTFLCVSGLNLAAFVAVYITVIPGVGVDTWSARPGTVICRLSLDKAEPQTMARSHCHQNVAQKGGTTNYGFHLLTLIYTWNNASHEYHGTWHGRRGSTEFNDKIATTCPILFATVILESKVSTFRQKTWWRLFYLSVWNT